MNKINLLIALAFIPAVANAYVAPTASSTINHIGFEVISGVAPEVNESGFSAYASATDFYRYSTVVDDSSTGSPFFVQADISGIAFAQAENSQATSVAYGSSFDDTSSMVNANYAYHYKAGTLLHFFGNVTLENTPGLLDDGTTIASYGQSGASIRVASSDNSLVSYSSLNAIGETYAKNSALDVYIFSPFDHEINFTVNLYSSTTPFISTVPEPLEVEMLIGGLGFLGFASTLKKS